MKKTIILIGVLLAAAVFMSGCVAETKDPVVGIWQSTEPLHYPGGTVFDPVNLIFNTDGTGYATAAFRGELVNTRADFTWKNLGGGKYERTIIAFDGYTNVSATGEFTVADGKVIFPIEKDMVLELVPAQLEKYAAGLWLSDKLDYKGYEDITAMVYLDEDKTGNVAVLAPNVTSADDIRSARLTWEVIDDGILLTGEAGGKFEIAVIDGGLSFDNLKPMHKYSVEDHIIGIWLSDKPYAEADGTYDIMEIIRDDGTGTEFWIVPGSDTAEETYEFTWELSSPYTYEAVFEDGEEWGFSFGGDMQIYDGVLWYSKISFDILNDYVENKVTA